MTRNHGLICLLILCVLVTPFQVDARIVSAGEDVRLVLEVAAGETDLASRDALLLNGVKYVRSMVDLSALVHAAGTPEARKEITRQGFARWSDVSMPCNLCDGSGHVGLGRLCPACHGAGWTGPMKVLQPFPQKCTFCDGTGKTVLGKDCPACHGAGLTGPAKNKKAHQPFPEKCTMCNGTGLDLMGHTCPMCHGAGLTGPAKSKALNAFPETCSLCNGTGKTALGKACPGCHGAGLTGPAKSKSHSPVPARCTMCNATGVDFMGRPCPMCHGAGWTGPFKSNGKAPLPAWCDLELEKVLKTRVLKTSDPAAVELLEEMKTRREQLLNR